MTAEKDPHNVWKLFEKHPDGFLKKLPQPRRVTRHRGGARVKKTEVQYSFIQAGEFGEDPNRGGYFERAVTEGCFKYLEEHGCLEPCSATRWMKGPKPPPL